MCEWPRITHGSGGSTGGSARARMSTGEKTSPERLSSPALLVLVVLMLATPWPFGSAHPLAVHAITLVALGTVLGVTVAQAARGHLILPSFPIWPFLGL